jgi:hypothetical protein
MRRIPRPQEFQSGGLYCLFSPIRTSERLITSAFVDGKTAEEAPHLALRRQSETRVGSSRNKDLWTTHHRRRNFDTPIHTRAVGGHQLASKRNVEADVV